MQIQPVKVWIYYWIGEIVDLWVGMKDNSGDHKSNHDLCLQINVCTKFHGNPSITSETIQFGPNWWTN